MSLRYDQLVPLIEAVKPQTIVEVGTHRGHRAALMVGEALKHHDEVHYIGYDVFETEAPDFHAEAYNGKGIPTEAEARELLDGIRENYPGFTYELRVGDTRRTLHGETVKADFAFIDGDHRVQVVEGDFWALADTPVIVLDDWYGADLTSGRRPDIDKVGCNRLVDALHTNGVDVTVLPDGNAIRGGGIAYLVLVKAAREEEE